MLNSTLFEEAVKRMLMSVMPSTKVYITDHWKNSKLKTAIIKSTKYTQNFLIFFRTAEPGIK
jgi:hypothetical protein